MIDEAGAYRAEADPGAGCELEVLGDAAIEQQALPGIVGVGKSERVADAIISVLIESLRG